jgi:light-regulated signal transduction histidine kinase (bacteriophytochrome)
MIRGSPPGSTAQPAFGEADLSNCEREPIHLAASVQPSGALLLVREADETIVQASANAAGFLGLSGSLLGRPLEMLGGNLYQRIRPALDSSLDTIPTMVRCRAGQPATTMDALLHRPQGGGLVIELAPAGAPVDLDELVNGGLRAILGSFTLATLCDAAARTFRQLTGYDRVMIYRFDDDGHGEVFSEEREPHLEPYRGNRYPASDIPQIARRLYERNRVRLLVDVNFTPVPLQPRLSPFTGADLDMSLCFLRSSSPIHVQYLKNMGVAATLVASIMVGGKLWGLVSCHHYSPRFLPFEQRAVCELLAEALGTRIAALESFVQAQAELTARRLEQRMIESISRAGDWRGALFDNPQALLQALDATGAALLFEGQVLTAGEVPGSAELRGISAWLADQPPHQVVASNSVVADLPELPQLRTAAAGLLATPVSPTQGEYLIWFRPERIRRLTWGGNPFKPVIVGNSPADLSPRRSFTQWHQVVEGTCEPWSISDLTTARLLGDTLADVVLQFRAVRMVIAQDQLAQVRRQVAVSDQPLLIADAAGRVTLTNAAFTQLLPPGPRGQAAAPLDRVEELLDHLAELPEMRSRLDDLLLRQRSWHGDVGLRQGPDGVRRLRLRADPVCNAAETVLGFIFLFTDLGERQAAEAARDRFQDSIVAMHRLKAGQLELANDAAFRRLFVSLLENARLAALEITDGLEMPRMPAMLDSVSASIGRATEVLEQLVRHARQDTEAEESYRQ